MKKLHYITTLIFGLLIALLLISKIYYSEDFTVSNESQITEFTVLPGAEVDHGYQPSPTPVIVPVSYEIPMRKHMFQTFNNCGPASLSMLLSYYNIDVSQQALGDYLRPRQHPMGIDDDKSVSLIELADHAENNYGLTAYHSPAGDLEMLKRLISNDIPVVVRTWLEVGEDIGHYRLIRGYDDSRNVIIQDDSYQDKDLSIPYDEFEQMWMPFSWEFLVLTTEEQKDFVESVLNERLDERDAWRLSLERSRSENTQYEQRFALFNQSRAHYHLGNYEEAIQLYESAADRLPGRMLWYQYEPILSYLQSENYDRVFAMTSNIISNNNVAYSEMYIIRGKAYQSQGQQDLARQEYEKAAFYNQNLEEPRRLLAQFGEN